MMKEITQTVLISSAFGAVLVLIVWVAVVWFVPIELPIPPE